MVPPTPPASASVYTTPPWGITGISPVIISGMSGTVMTARPTMTTNMMPTMAAVIFSMTAYRPSHTIPNPSTPMIMAHAHSGRNGNRAARGSADEDMAVAPYTKPQMMMYGPKYQEVQRPRDRQPSKMVRPLARE